MEITVRMFVRKESEKDFRDWDSLTKEEVIEYTNHIDRAAALSCGYVENTKE